MREIISKVWLTAGVIVLCCAVAATAQNVAESVEPTNAAAATQFAGAPLVNLAPGFLAGVRTDRENRMYGEGDFMQVEFGAERDAFLYLLYHQADGTSRLLFPNAARRDNRIAASTIVKVPNEADGFRFRARPPFGVEHLQAVASAEVAPELDGLIQDGRPTAAVPAEVIARLGDRLRQTPQTWAEHHVDIVTRPSDASPSSREAARCGLFIGIGKYLNPELVATHDALRRSAELLHAAMLERGGLDPARTKLVTDEQATRGNLQSLIYEWLPSVSRPGDVVFIYFSGHAGQTDNGDPTELDGKDETLAPYDLEAGEDGMPVQERMRRHRASVISDDELARWLQALAGRQVVLILDTCHSAGVVESKDLFDEAQRIKDISQLNAVVLASCGADEQSLFEGTPDNTMWFTHFLVQAVKKVDALTAVDAFRYASQGIREVIKRRNESRIQEPAMHDTALLPIYLVPQLQPRETAGSSP